VRHKHLSKLSKLQHGEAPHRGCLDAADPKGKDHPDLLGEEAADDSIWWRWKRARRRVFRPRWRQRRPPELAGEARRRRRSSCRQRVEGSERRVRGAGLGRLTNPNPSRLGLTEPSGPIGPIGPNGPRPFVKTNFKFRFECYFLFELIQTQNSNNKDKKISYSLIK
jgi:hypothetical protein